jgi:uncharacterized membrane protein YkvA (DUF1232 family)
VFVTGLIGLGVSLLVLWIVLAAAIFVARPRSSLQYDAVGYVPKVIRLIWALAHDHTLPRTVRWRLWIAVGYNIRPINLIPHFIPVIGFVDNLVVLGWALRSTVRLAGNSTVTEHWTGSHDELVALYRLMRITPVPT